MFVSRCAAGKPIDKTLINLYTKTIMALSDQRILNEMREGNIIISPYDERNLSTSSYDVTLGSFFYRMGGALPKSIIDLHRGGQIFNPYSGKDTALAWGNVQEAKEAKFEIDTDVWESHKDEVYGIAPTDKIIMLSPRSTVLAHTEEFIGGRDHITTMMKSRSSMGRQGIAVCKCAGWGDVGYINRWTMEITNFTNYFVPLVVGRRIAQIVFFDTGPIRGIDYSVQGKYQTSEILADLEKNWKPSDMLPKLYKDRDIKHA